MAVTITPGSVLKGADAQTATGIAGASITAGQTLYLDATTNTLKLADANASVLTAAVVGISLHAAGIGQPITYQTTGSITIGGTLTVGGIYINGAGPGEINAVADLVTGWRTSILGVASTTAILILKIYNSGVAVTP